MPDLVDEALASWEQVKASATLTGWTREFYVRDYLRLRLPECIFVQTQSESNQGIIQLEPPPAPRR